MYCPAQLPGRSSVISGELQAGGNSICLCLTGVLLWPPKRPIWTACAHFLESYPIDVLHLYFNILCLLLLLSRWISTIYFSSLTCLCVLRSLGTDLSGINKAFSQVILLKGNVSGDDIFLRSLNLNYYFLYMGWRFKHFWIAYLLWY